MDWFAKWGGWDLNFDRISRLDIWFKTASWDYSVYRGEWEIGIGQDSWFKWDLKNIWWRGCKEEAGKSRGMKLGMNWENWRFEERWGNDIGVVWWINGWMGVIGGWKA